MNLDPTSNPAVAGLSVGFVILAGKWFWGRVMGRADGEESIPSRLKNIDTNIANIQSTLLLTANDNKHKDKRNEELYDDFWDHMDKHHASTRPKRRIHETDEE